MGTSGTKTVTLGFLTAVEHEQQGVYGGYLILSASGRPLEFHCTAPVKPSRPQQILYGPTLEPYLYGEVIGQTLLEKASAQPHVVCVDRESMLAVRALISIPVVLVRPAGSDLVADPAASASNDKPLLRLDSAHRSVAPSRHFSIGRNQLSVAAAHTADRETVSQRLAELAETFDLLEPFSRIRDALKEAQQSP